MTSRLMPRAFASPLWAACLGFALVAGSGAAQAETLTLGNEGVYPPFSMVDAQGKVTGVEPDLAHEACKRMNVECEIVVMDFKALIPSMLQGKFDVMISQIIATPERKEKMLFLRRLYANPSMFVVPADFDFKFDKEYLKGKGLKLGIQRGSSFIKYMQEQLGDSIEYVFYDNPDQSRMDLLAGRINSVFEAKINVTLQLLDKPEGKKWKLAPGEYWTGDPSVPEAERGLTWAVRKDRPELVDRFNTAITAMIEDCTYTKIRKKYLDITTLPEDAACEAKMN